MSASVVTISAPYGTGGGIVGPVVAERLGVPFLDRAIPIAVAKTLAVPVDDVLARDERGETRLGRVLSALAASGVAWGSDPAAPVAGWRDEDRYRDETERVIRDTAKTTGAVILGRAAVIVLRDDPAALHVCLSGPFERRVRRALAVSKDGEPSVRRLLEDSDRTRAAYFRLYKADPGDSRLYHLVIDSTVLDYDTVVELIITAAVAKAGAATAH
jgi:cytidylate kinase